MYHYYKKKASILFTITLISLIVLFSLVGSTLAYFQIETHISGQYKIGVVGATWYNNTTALTESTTYSLSNLENKLKRGDTVGANLLKVDGTTGGDLRVRADDGSAGQYVRVKPTATIDGDDVTSYLTFNYIFNNNTNQAGSGSFWPKDSAGWYYYLNSIEDGGYAIFCNNIVLSASIPSKYTGKEMSITFEFESVQSANSPILDHWGEEVAEIYGV